MWGRLAWRSEIVDANVPITIERMPFYYHFYFFFLFFPFVPPTAARSFAFLA